MTGGYRCRRTHHLHSDGQPRRRCSTFRSRRYSSRGQRNGTGSASCRQVSGSRFHRRHMPVLARTSRNAALRDRDRSSSYCAKCQVGNKPRWDSRIARSNPYTRRSSPTASESHACCQAPRSRSRAAADWSSNAHSARRWSGLYTPRRNRPGPVHRLCRKCRNCGNPHRGSRSGRHTERRGRGSRTGRYRGHVQPR